MPSRPPETAFYNVHQQNYTLWRDISRLYEDFPSRADFITILEDIIERLHASEREQYLQAVKEYENRPEGQAGT